MQTKHFDFIVIGSGAGNIVVDYALAAGMTVALIERKHWGGTCLNHGCIPTKIMATPADLIRESKQFAKIGLKGSELSADWQHIVRRTTDKILANRKDVVSYYDAQENCTLYHGAASFIGERKINVELNTGGTVELTAKNVVIGCGGTQQCTDLPA